jgi:biopolymer transport protein ExbB/TolQ
VEGSVPFAIALIFGVLLLAAVFFSVLWVLIFLVPLYVYTGAAAYLIWRTRRRESDLHASVRREAEQQRLFNEQEMRAWQATLGKNQRNAAKREKALRDFDRSRDPPTR